MLAIEMKWQGNRVMFTYFDLRWPSSISPSTSMTWVIDTISPTLSPAIVMLVNSRSIHSFPQLVIFLFFQCQLAVENAIGGAAAVDIVKRGWWEKAIDTITNKSIFHDVPHLSSDTTFNLQNMENTVLSNFLGVPKHEIWAAQYFCVIIITAKMEIANCWTIHVFRCRSQLINSVRLHILVWVPPLSACEQIPLVFQVIKCTWTLQTIRLIFFCPDQIRFTVKICPSPTAWPASISSISNYCKGLFHREKPPIIGTWPADRQIASTHWNKCFYCAVVVWHYQ